MGKGRDPTPTRLRRRRRATKWCGSPLEKGHDRRSSPWRMRSGGSEEGREGEGGGVEVGGPVRVLTRGD